jgi:hypothetical protein
VRALVIYESMFGDNQQVAREVAGGLSDVGVVAEAVEVGVAPRAVPSSVDLVVVGSPNHGFSLPRTSSRADAAKQADRPLVSQGDGVREWLSSATLPRGVHTAGYDTRGSHPKALVRMDHASSSIEKGLAKLGGITIAPAEHFRVSEVKGPLEPGELARARGWGATLGRLLSA